MLTDSEGTGCLLSVHYMERAGPSGLPGSSCGDSIAFVMSGVPNFQDLITDDLMELCNNNRNKGHNKCNVLESSQSHPTQSMEKLSSMKLVPGAKKVGAYCVK